MRCEITGFETDNKWNNRPVSKDAVSAAKNLVLQKPWLTMKKAFAMIRQDVLDYYKEKAEKELTRETIVD